MSSTVKVPAAFVPVFAEAEQRVSAFFDQMVRDPTKGVIHIANERYILIRGESLFSSLREQMYQQFGEEVLPVLTPAQAARFKAINQRREAEFRKTFKLPATNAPPRRSKE